MIVEGLVTIKQDGTKLHLQNHLTAGAAMCLFRMLIGNTLYAASTDAGQMSGDTLTMNVYLMRTFELRFGIGETRIPAYNLTALENQKLILSENSESINGVYNDASHFDKVYSAQATAFELCSGAAGVTISTIKDSVVAIVNDPPITPDTGSIYIVGTAPTGDFVSYDNQVATWNGATWEFEIPTNLCAAYIIALNATYRYNGTNWIVIPPIRECGLFTYGYASSDAYLWNASISGLYSSTTNLGNTYFLAAYIAANGATPDFEVGSINLCKSIVVEWALRISFAGDS